MKQATQYSDEARYKLGLLDLATVEDKEAALETSGFPTDMHRVEASKMFGVEYCFVTPQQRQAAKQARFWSMYR